MTTGHPYEEGRFYGVQGSHFESEIILQCVRWYLSYPLSYRNLEEMMLERGIEVDHSTVNRWVLKYTPELEKSFRKYKRPTGSSWRLDETYIRLKGKWAYLYRAVDKCGETIDFLLTAKRDWKAAKRFLKKAIRNNGEPEKINIDKSGANTAGINAINKEAGSKFEIRQCKYLNNIVEQDHRRIKRKIDPMMGFGSFNSAKITLAGIETIAMLKKNQSDVMPLFVRNRIDAYNHLTR
ncbi:MAG: IS6 family transposase [Bdellovibrionia bacterium]